MRKAKLAGLAASMIGILAGALGTGTASATYLEVGGEPKHEPITFQASLAPHNSMVVRNTGFTDWVTCSQSQLHAETAQPFIGETVTGAVSAMSYTGGCEVTVHKMGLLHFQHIENSTNAIVRSSGAEITAFVLGLNLTCKTGTGVELGRLTGVKEGHATLHLNAVLNCGFVVPDMVWQGTYQVTSPTGLGVSSEDTTLEVGGSKKVESISLEASLKSGTSIAVKTMTGELRNTCTGSVVKGSTTEPYTGDEVHGLSSWTWSGCASSLGTVASGSLSIIRIPSTTHGTVLSSGAWFFIQGAGSCKTNNTPIGTLTGVKEGHATLDINAVLDCGSSPPARLEGTYTVTSPTGLGVTS